MAKLTVGDIRKAIKGMKDSDPVVLDIADPIEDSHFQIDGVGNYGGTLQISVSDALLYDDEDDDDEECDHPNAVESDPNPPATWHCPDCGENFIYDE